MDLAELLRGMSDEDPVKREYDETTARQLLTDAVVKLDEQHSFKRGQFIRKKRGVESGVRDHAGGVAVFLQYEDRENALTGIFAMAKGDCIIGAIADDGAMIEISVNARHYEPADAA